MKLSSFQTSHPPHKISTQVCLKLVHMEVCMRIGLFFPAPTPAR